MNASYWQNLWVENDIRFHREELNEYLIKNQALLGPLAGQTVCLPLCGKSLELAWFAEQGANVMGYEVSSIAITSFFEEHGLDYTVRKDGDFEVYESGRITIYCGDFLSHVLSESTCVDIIYDRAALIALSPQQRKPYIKNIHRLIKPEGKIFLICLSYDCSGIQRPPYSVKEEEVRAHYEKNFQVQLLDNCEIDDIPAHWKERGIANVKEQVYLIANVRSAVLATD